MVKVIWGTVCLGYGVSCMVVADEASDWETGGDEWAALERDIALSQNATYAAIR